MKLSRIFCRIFHIFHYREYFDGEKIRGYCGKCFDKPPIKSESERRALPVKDRI